eukprot:GFUD01131223.1.p1 GENE.GFUD01131223.1~~GFUD01131223.1.p1  ORF type:complete len:100 (-),score=14.42 GFUD01131223.1:56-355(-)
MNSRGNMPKKQPNATPRPRPKFAQILDRGISSCSGVRSGGWAPNLSAQDSTYQADPMPIISEIVFPKAAAAIVEIPSLAPLKNGSSPGRTGQTYESYRE